METPSSCSKFLKCHVERLWGKTHTSESKWQRGWSCICHGHAPRSVRNLCIKLQLVRFPSECKVDVQNIIENMMSLCNFRLFCILVIPVYRVWLIPACHFAKILQGVYLGLRPLAGAFRGHHVGSCDWRSMRPARQVCHRIIRKKYHFSFMPFSVMNI